MSADMSAHAGHSSKLSASALLLIRLRLHPRPCSMTGFRRQPRPRPQQSTQPQTRHFSVSDVAGGLLRGSEILITNVHQVTGTPWCLSIPLVALAVSVTIRTPLTLYAHSIQRKKARLLPLLQAQYAQIGLGLRRRAVPNLMHHVRRAVKKTSDRTFKVFALDGYRSLWGGLAGLPIFISNLEVIRSMCGGPRGLIGALISRMGEEAQTWMTTTAASPLEDPSIMPESLASITIEPTMATGGCLWFPNLLVPDPYHILPFAVSALLLMHIVPETAAQRRALFGLNALSEASDKMPLRGQSRLALAFRRTMLMAALAIGPMTMDMPAALHLYWLSSAAISLAVIKGVETIMPLPKSTVRPCRGMEIPLLRPRRT